MRKTASINIMEIGFTLRDITRSVSAAYPPPNFLTSFKRQIDLLRHLSEKPEFNTKVPAVSYA
jgi:hypothetical protein